MVHLLFTSVIVLAALGLLAMAPRRWQLLLLVVVSCLPFGIGAIGPYADIRFAELAALPLLPIIILDMLTSRRRVVARGTGVIWLAVAALFVAATLNLIRTSGEATGIARVYVDMFSSIALFVEVAWLAGDRSVGDDTWIRLLRTLLVVGVVVGLLRVASFYGGFTLPVLGGTFDYGGTRMLEGVAVDRIGGLAEVTTLLLAASAGLWIATAKRGAPLLGMLCGLLFALMSGGRSLTIGVLIGGAVMLLALAPRHRWRYVGGIAVAITVAGWIGYLNGLGRQLTRLTALGGGLARQDPYRSEAISILWRQFLANPVLGKGLGVAVPGIPDPFINKVVTWGGHGAYSTLLGNFGVFGGFTIFMMTGGVVFYAVVGAARVRRRSPDRHVLTGLFTFVVVFMSIRAIELSVGGNGYTDTMMFVVAGLVAGVWPLTGTRAGTRSGAVKSLEAPLLPPEAPS